MATAKIFSPGQTYDGLPVTWTGAGTIDSPKRQFIGGIPVGEYMAGKRNTSGAGYNTTFSTLYPDLTATQGQVSANTLARLRGELSPETLNAIQNTAARFGVGAGMPLGAGGTSLAGQYGRKLLGTSVEGLQTQGLQDYLNTLKAYSGTLMPTTGETIGAQTSRYSTDVGAATQRYATDIAAKTAAANLAEQAKQFGLTFPESQRQFDYAKSLQNQQYQQGLGLDWAKLAQNSLNSYLQFLS